jgi:hypothetical protein
MCTAHLHDPRQIALDARFMFEPQMALTHVGYVCHTHIPTCMAYEYGACFLPVVGRTYGQRRWSVTETKCAHQSRRSVTETKSLLTKV